MVAAVLGILVLSGAILAFSGSSKSMRMLVSGADAKDLGEVVDVLKANQVEFEYGASGDSILVPEDQVANLRMELAMKGLPKSGDVGYEIFDEGNFGISDFVQPHLLPHSPPPHQKEDFPGYPKPQHWIC